MSQKNMRTRNLDQSKPMIIYDATKDDVLEKMDQQGVLRQAILPPTGIEKDEESEHHLQMALTAVQQGINDSQGIPVPKVEEIKDIDHDILYPVGYKKGKELYRVQGLSSGPEPDVVDYSIDEADDAWLKEIGTKFTLSVDRFESIIDRLEKATGAQCMSESDACKLLKDRSDLALAVYAYWLSKRKRLSHALVSRVRTENKRDSGSGHDPYVAFRRRAEKMQTRKNRKNDELNYILMFKMRIAHTGAMRDGLMDILKGVREREILKLRTSLMERYEWQLGNAVFDDPAGSYQSHVLDNYPELNRIEAETLDDVDHDDEGDREPSEAAKDDGESLEDFSDVSDSGNESDSWSHIHHPDLKHRSPQFDDREDASSNLASTAPLDPNLVPETQYRGEEPPEYWGPDGEFTFVPRKGCKYYQVQEETDTTDSDQPEDPLRGFFLQEIPVFVGRSVVMKTVMARRTCGLHGVKQLEYYKLPAWLDSFDLSLLYQQNTLPEEAELTAWKAAVCETKKPVYVHCDEAIREEFPVPEEPLRWNLTEEDVEDLFQAALRWPLDAEAPSTTILEEDEEPYQLACTSINQPLLEHSYCKQPIYGDLSWLDAQTVDGDAEDATSQQDGTDTLSVESLGESGSLAAVSSHDDDHSMPTAAVLSVEMVSGKKRPPVAKKAKAAANKTVTGATNEHLMAGGGIKRMKPEPATTIGTAKDLTAQPKKPPRKRAKAAVGITEDNPQSENQAAVTKPFDSFQVPQIPPVVTATGLPITIGLVAKKPPVKRSVSVVKTPANEGGTNGIQNGNDSDSNKKAKKKPAVPRKPKDDSGSIIPSQVSPAILTSGLVPPPKSPPHRPILPLSNTTLASSTTVMALPASITTGTPTPATLTFSPTPLRATLPSLIGSGRLTYSPASSATITTNPHPNLHSLLINNNTTPTPMVPSGIVPNGYHGASAAVPNGINNNMAVTSKTY